MMAGRRYKRSVRLVTTEVVEHVAEAGVEVLSAAPAGELLIELIGRKDREHFVALHLDVKNRVRSVDKVAIGTVSSALVHPREVFKGAILANASGLILGHNHPSGVLEPSREDWELHRRLKDAGQIVGIPVLDWLIVSRDGWWSEGSP